MIFVHWWIEFIHFLYATFSNIKSISYLSVGSRSVDDSAEMLSLNTSFKRICESILMARSTVVCFWSEVHRLAWIICIYIHHSIGLQQFHFSIRVCVRACVRGVCAERGLLYPKTKSNKHIKYVDWTQLIANIKQSNVNIQWDRSISIHNYTW